MQSTRFICCTTIIHSIFLHKLQIFFTNFSSTHECSLVNLFLPHTQAEIHRLSRLACRHPIFCRSARSAPFTLFIHPLQKLEETVAENARLEQDLVVLRQKLQASRRYAGNVHHPRDPSAGTGGGTTAALEKELRRVQQLVGDLQRQRQELSIQVRQLTEKSHSLVQQIRPQATSSEFFFRFFSIITLKDFSDCVDYKIRIIIIIMAWKCIFKGFYMYFLMDFKVNGFFNILFIVYF